MNAFNFDNKVNLVIAYTGELVDDGTMDVRDLGPALMSLGTLVNEANKLVNADNSSIAVKVNADFQKGSFEIQLELVRTLADQIQNLFTPTVSTKELIELLGLAGSTQSLLGLPNLMDLIRWSKRNPIKKAKKREDGRVEIISENESMVVHANVVNVFQSVAVRESLNGVIAPTKRVGIDSFQVRQNGMEVQTILKEDAENFTYNEAEIDVEDKKNVQETEQWVRILTVNFEDLKWRFQSGENKFYAKIDDEKFLGQINNGEISFTNGDTLKVKLEQTQLVKNDGNIKNEYRVVSVLEFNKRGKQIELPFDLEE